jgi:hypothetical protein
MKHLHNIPIHSNHYTVMFIIMILSGLFSTMNIWVDKLDDIRYSINDLYMTLLMTGWMFFFMGLYYREKYIILIGIVLVIMNIWCIRKQFLINEKQYKLGMIPHHSMAIHMSKKLLERSNSEYLQNNIGMFLKNLINTQEKEILFLKQ